MQIKFLPPPLLPLRKTIKLSKRALVWSKTEALTNYIIGIVRCQHKTILLIKYIKTETSKQINKQKKTGNNLMNDIQVCAEWIQKLYKKTPRNIENCSHHQLYFHPIREKIGKTITASLNQNHFTTNNPYLQFQSISNASKLKRSRPPHLFSLQYF